MSIAEMPPTGGLVDWDEVQVGDIVKGKDGGPWTVMSRDTTARPAKVMIENQANKSWTLQPTGTVEVLSSAREEMEFAKATTQIRLGGALVSDTDEHGRHLAPVTFAHPGSLIAHIYLLHGRIITNPPEDQDIRDLIATHDKLHLPENRTVASGWVDHVHEPDFYEKRNL